MDVDCKGMGDPEVERDSVLTVEMREDVRFDDVRFDVEESREWVPETGILEEEVGINMVGGAGGLPDKRNT